MKLNVFLYFLDVGCLINVDRHCVLCVVLVGRVSSFSWMEFS